MHVFLDDMILKGIQILGFYNGVLFYNIYVSLQFSLVITFNLINVHVGASNKVPIQLFHAIIYNNYLV